VFCRSIHTAEPNAMVTTSKRLSNQEVLRFYGRVRNLVKRYPPHDYAPFVASRILRFADHPEKWQSWPPHTLLHSIEANCSYYCRGYNETMTEQQIVKILKAYAEFDDPYLVHLLEEERNPLLALYAMFRQQFVAQQKVSPYDFGRCLLMFIENNPMLDSSEEFNRKFSLSLQQWVYLCLLTSSMVHARASNPDRPPTFRLENLERGEVPMPAEALRPFFQLLSKSPKEVGQMFREVRNGIEPRFHICVRSLFLQYPIIVFENGEYLAPHEGFVLMNAWEGPYRLLRGADRFSQELGAAFQGYVGLIIPDIPNRVNVLAGPDLKRALPDRRTCDFLVETADSIILIECKATVYSATLVTEGAIRGDNSTTKIADSFDQLHQTATAVREGSLSDRLTDAMKPIVGITVVLGDIPFLNEPGLRQNIFLPKMPRTVATWPHPLVFEPQVFPIRMFEKLIVAMKALGQSALEIIREKIKLPYEKVGDWFPYLNNLLQANKDAPDVGLAAPTEAFNRYRAKIESRNVRDLYQPKQKAQN